MAARILMSTAMERLSTYHTSRASLSSHVRGVASANLGETGQSRSHLMPAFLLVVIPTQVLGEQGPRAYQTHIASEHVEQLGKLIETPRPKQTPEPRESLTVRSQVPVLVEVLGHSAKLVQREQVAAETRSLTSVEHRRPEEKPRRQRNEGQSGSTARRATDSKTSTSKARLIVSLVPFIRFVLGEANA